MQKFKYLVGVFVLAAVFLAACGAGSTADNVMDGNNGSSMGENAIDNNDNMADNMEDEIANSEDMSEEPHDAMDDSMNDSMEEKDDSMMEEDSDKDAGMMEEVMAPPWFGHEFTDAVTGETFTINGFRGQVVLVETMAMWCSNCMRQQQQVRELHNLLGEREDLSLIHI